MMAGLYDYTPGINAINQSLMNFSNTIAQRKHDAAVENAQNIMNTKNMFELDRLHKQEVENDKPVMFLSMLEARGTPKSVLDKTLQYGRSMGVMDEVGRVTKRNIPAFMTAMNSDKQFQLDITQGHFDDVSEKIALMDQDIEKMREKQDPNKQQDFANLIRQRDQLKVKQMNYKGLMDNLLGRKQDTSLTEAEILALPETDPRRIGYVKGKKELEGNKPKTPIIHTFTEGNQTVDKQWDAEIGAWKEVSRGPRYKPDSGDRGPTPYQIQTNTTKLRQEFNARPEVKEYNQVAPKIAVIDAALAESKGPNKVAADQALITVYNKITDPQSVVRESEYARTPENLSLINKLAGKMQKVNSGGAGLTDDDRQAIAKMAKNMYRAYQDVFDRTAQEFTGYAIGYNVDPKLVIGERRKTQPSSGSGIDLDAVNAELARRKGKK